MKSTIKSFCNFIVIILFVILMTYVSFFTDIPSNTGNFLREKIEESTNSYEEYSSDFVINKLSINMNTYYYDLLTEDQKKIYSSIANGVKNLQDEFVVRDYIAKNKEDFASEVSFAIEAFTNDHPEVFYLQSKYSSYVVSSFSGNFGYIRLNYTEDSKSKIESKINEMDSAINNYLKDIDGLTDFEKELKIHDELSYNVTYSKLEEIPREYHTAEGALLENIGVCDSFTKALQLIYNKAGIDSIIVLGSLDGSPHAWNLVKIEDEWYHVDLTSSHSVYDDTGIVNHAYFNLSDEKVKKISVMDDESIIPDATSDKYNYYEYNDLLITENDNLNERLEEICKKFEDKSYIEFYLEGNVGDKISKVLTALKSIDSSFVNNSKMYYYNIQNDIIIPKN